MPESLAGAAAAVSELPRHAGARVTLRGWLLNRRDSKGLAFLVLRDGTGFVQVVVPESGVDTESWAAAAGATQESALEVAGEVRLDGRQEGGVELQADRVVDPGVRLAHPRAARGDAVVHRDEARYAH